MSCRFTASVSAVTAVIVMNAGLHEFEIGNHVRSVRFLDTEGSLDDYPCETCRFVYRGSRFRGSSIYRLRERSGPSS